MYAEGCEEAKPTYPVPQPRRPGEPPAAPPPGNDRVPPVK